MENGEEWSRQGLNLENLSANLQDRAIFASKGQKIALAKDAVTRIERSSSSTPRIRFKINEECPSGFTKISIT